ncbi:MAG: hypothetical protein IT427_19460 [Pirellulales bacterium]|nr:hypothetical protein [Pirellulales bacterium]
MSGRSDTERLPAVFGGNRMAASPMVVFYEIARTKRFVFHDGRGHRAKDATSTELAPCESRRLVGQLSRYTHPPVLVLTGGDPLERDELCSFVELAQEPDCSYVPFALQEYASL